MCKKVLSLVLSLLLVFSLPVFSLAADYSSPNIEELFRTLSSEDPEFSNWASLEYRLAYVCYDSDDLPCIELYHVLDGNSVVGYFVFNSSNGQILEYSNGIDAFSKVSSELSIKPSKFYYKGFINEVVCDDQTISFDEFGNFSVDGSLLDTYTVLPGVSPQLQGSRNCIVAAMGNLIYYWWQNKSLSLSSSVSSYSGICNALNSIMLSYGGYANAYIGKTITSFISKYATDASISYDYTWYPSFGTAKGEINSGRPCLVGFAAGSTYSDDVGHMTCCVGYDTIGGTNYLKLADGHSAQVVNKAWTSYNDYVFMCYITIDGSHVAPYSVAEEVA